MKKFRVWFSIHGHEYVTIVDANDREDALIKAIEKLNINTRGIPLHFIEQI